MPGSRPTLWRITDRATFAALRRGRRARRGAVVVTFVALPEAVGAPPRVAFAVGRGAGGAVVRNRIRRRLRAGLRELQVAGRLPEGAYLVGAGAAAAALPWPELLEQLTTAVGAATGEPTS